MDDRADGGAGEGFGEWPKSDRPGTPPHPDDRLWRHPSELRDVPMPSAMRTSSGGQSRRTTGRKRRRERRRQQRRGHSWALLFLAAGSGAAVATAALMFMGPNSRTVIRRVTERVTLGPDPEPPTTLATNSVTEINPAAPGDGSPDPMGSNVDEVVVTIEGPVAEGSGFILSSDGTIVTSAALLGYSSNSIAAVTMSDGRQLDAEILGQDRLTDIAILRLPTDRHTPATLAQRTPPSGQQLSLIASAAPASAERTSGRLSSVTASVGRDTLAPLDGQLQIHVSALTTATGGPVLDDRGAVVGMTTHPMNDWAYATPIEVVTKVADDIIATGHARHAGLGIRGEDVSGSVSVTETDTGTDTDTDQTVERPAQAVDQSEPTSQPPLAGVLVTSVEANGPASLFLEEGDVIVAWSETPVPNMATLHSLLLQHRPDDVVQLAYWDATSGETETADITLGVRPS